MKLQIHSLRGFLCPFFSLACILSISTGCLAQPNIGGSAPLDTRFTRPTNLIDLLRNFKLAMDEALFWRDDFYTDSVIKAFSGGQKVIWDSVPEPRKYWGDVVDFAEVVKPRLGLLIPDLTIYFRGRSKDEKGIVAYWALSTGGPTSPTFSEVESVMGSDWRKRELWPLPHRAEASPTDPHGNAHIYYKASGHGLERTMFFDFRPDGRLSTAYFWAREVSR